LQNSGAIYREKISHETVTKQFKNSLSGNHEGVMERCWSTKNDPVGQ